MLKPDGGRNNRATEVSLLTISYVFIGPRLVTKVGRYLTFRVQWRKNGILIAAYTSTCLLRRVCIVMRFVNCRREKFCVFARCSGFIDVRMIMNQTTLRYILRSKIVKGHLNIVDNLCTYLNKRWLIEPCHDFLGYS